MDRDPDCLFCKIVAREIPADFVYEDDDFCAFRDINPSAPVHVLVIPRRHVSSLSEADGLTEHERARLPIVLRDVAHLLGLAESGYRVVTNTGPDARQSVFHMHWHILGGKELSSTM